MKRLSTIFGLWVLVAGCAGGPLEEPVGQGVHLSIAPLDLPGIADAVWDIMVENNRTPTPDVVWTARITSSQYGDGAGSASYVGPCDADPATASNTITVNIVGIYTSALPAGSAGDYGGPAPSGGEPFNDPGDLTRTFTCVHNEDVPVQFDVSLMRPANQGFFDIAVNFNQIYCSAKFDCCYNDRGSDPSICEANESMNLLYDNTGSRAASYVMGFACTAGASASVDTALLLDDIVVTCDGSGGVAAGNYTLDVNPALPAGNQGGNAVFFQWASYRGVEFVGTISKIYWNFVFGVGGRDLAGCTLHTQGTADDGADSGDGVDYGTYQGIAANITYPIIGWSVPLGYGGACTEHPLNTTPFVNTTYTGTVHDPVTFDHQLTAAAPGLPPAADGTISGTNVVVNAYAAITADVAAGTTILPVDAAVASANDRVLILQVQGPGDVAGTWELANVVAATANSLTLSAGLQHSYTSGLFDQADAHAAQVIRVARYGALTISGSVTAPAWDGTKGGVVALEATTGMTFVGAGAVHVDGAGFRGPPREHIQGANGRVGEGVLGNPMTRCANENTLSASLTGGCGAIEGTQHSHDGVAAAGGGANEAVPPNDGYTYQSSTRYFAHSGEAYRAGEFDPLVFGGGGGQGDSGTTGDWTSLAKGGDGGGVVLLVSPSVTSPVVTAVGTDGEQGCDYYGDGGDWGVSGGGGGAGGTIHLVTSSVSGGSLTATGGVGGTICGHEDQAQSRSGGAGRVRVEASFSGSSDPTAH